MAKKVKVKVAVCVGGTGKWSASGWSNENGVITEDTLKLAREIAEEGVDEKLFKIYYVTAELEVPEHEVIEGVAGEVHESE